MIRSMLLQTSSDLSPDQLFHQAAVQSSSMRCLLCNLCNVNAFHCKTRKSVRRAQPLPGRYWGHVTSWGMWPFDTPGAISYWCAIVSESVSPAVFEILGPDIIGSWYLDLSGSRDIISHMAVHSIRQFATCHFLLVVHWNQASISKAEDSRPRIKQEFKNSRKHWRQWLQL